MDVAGKITSDDLARLVPLLSDQLPDILTEVRARLQDGWPDYATYLDQEQVEVTAAARAFLTWLVDFASVRLPAGQPPAEVAEAVEAVDPPHLAMFEVIGRLESREGRDLSLLLSAYQVGGRVAWRYVSRAALQLGVEPGQLAALAEAVFVFVDQLSAASARGYVREQSEAAAEREHRREELVDLLLSARADQPALRSAATRAGWALPKEAAIVLTDPENPIGQTFLSRLDSRTLPVRRPGLVGAVVPDPLAPGQRARLSRALRGAGAVVGPPVPLAQLPASVAIAQTAAELRRRGVLTDDPVLAEEHLDAILVHRDPWLLATLQRRVLQPLQDQSPASRERLIETLRAWLRHFGDHRAIAAELHIHPQTVRYRMNQLSNLFGSTLDSPELRVQLLLALAFRDVRPDHRPGKPPPGGPSRPNRQRGPT
jgi:hypothetical protein